MNLVTKHTVFKIFYVTLGLGSLLFAENFFLVFLCWFFMAIGNGTIGHRYFAHNQFTADTFRHWIFALWCTVSAYSSVMYWQVQHRHHHRHSDTIKDIHSPINGFWQSFLTWPFNRSRIQSVFDDRMSKVNLIKSIEDKAVKITSDNFIIINIVFLLLLTFVNINLLLAYAVAFLIENLRLGIINSILHIKNFPGNYRNFETKDNSHNNIILGFVTLGFGWHNNHHADSKKLNLREKWWEVDVEGLIGKILEKDIKNGQ